MPKEIKLPESLDAEQAADVLREYAATDEAQIIDQDTLSALRAEIDEAKEAFAAVIAEQSPQSAETLARQDMDALTEPFRDDDGDISVDTLRQTPETQTGGGAAPDEGDTDDGFDPETLTLSQNEELKQLQRKRVSFQNRGIESRAKDLEQEMCDVVGVDDFDTLEQEVF